MSYHRKAVFLALDKRAVPAPAWGFSILLDVLCELADQELGVPGDDMGHDARQRHIAAWAAERGVKVTV